MIKIEKKTRKTIGEGKYLVSGEEKQQRKKRRKGCKEEHRKCDMLDQGGDVTILQDNQPTNMESLSYSANGCLKAEMSNILTDADI